MGTIRSALLDRYGFLHGFSNRAGGVSETPFATLNLGYQLGDLVAAVNENRARFARAVGVPLERLFDQRQVHGTEVREISAKDEVSVVREAEGDALISRHQGLGVAARTADCVPVLLAHPPSGHVAAVHAGWRGAVGGIVERAIAALSHPPEELLCALGPHIRVDAFEIGEEVAERMEGAAKGRDVVDRTRHKPHGDLARLLTFQLLDAGVPRLSIDDVGGCTHSDSARFFSHRRDRGETGRHLSAIVAGAPRSC